MIVGIVKAREARIRLTIRGFRGRACEIEAVVDTGYTGWLTLSPTVIAALDLRWQTFGRGTLADGSVSFFDVYPSEGGCMEHETHTFTLILSGVAELTPVLADALYAATQGEIELNLRDGLAFLRVERAAPTLRRAITTAIREVEGASVGVRVVCVQSEAANVIAKINADLLGMRGATQRRHSKEEFARRGDAIYKNDVRPQLKADDDGKFAAIDIESGIYAIDADELKAGKKLRARIPDAQIWMVRVGYRAVHRFGGREQRETP